MDMSEPGRRRGRIGQRGLMLALAAVLPGGARSGPPAHPTPGYLDLPANLPGTVPFAVIGDPQETLFWERNLLFRETNPVERDVLFRRLADRRPEFLVIVGDLTCDGSSEKHWGYFDRLTAAMRDERLPILPVMGNHDYWGNPAGGARRFEVRFLQFASSHWYARMYGRLALVFLDANVAVLSRRDWQRQQEWYEQTLAAYEADPVITGVLVFEHQPPFTNGTATHDDLDVQLAFVPAFLRSRKTLAMISGHTHAYEHFIEQGKHFIVTGGGGGPRVRLREGARQRHLDLYRGAAPRPFHYLWITPNAQGLSVGVEGLNKGETAFTTIDQFDLSY